MQRFDDGIQHRKNLCAKIVYFRKKVNVIYRNDDEKEIQRSILKFKYQFHINIKIKTQV